MSGSCTAGLGLEPGGGTGVGDDESRAESCCPERARGEIRAAHAEVLLLFRELDDTGSKSTSRLFVQLGLRIACASTVYTPFGQGPTLRRDATHGPSKESSSRALVTRTPAGQPIEWEPDRPAPHLVVDAADRKRGGVVAKAALIPVVAPVAPVGDSDALERPLYEGATGGRSGGRRIRSGERDSEKAHVPIVRPESARG
jgi:hypothetical protein